MWISCYPDNPYASLVCKPGEREFNITNFIVNELKLDWCNEYKLLSRFSHSNSLTVIESLVNNSQYNTPQTIAMVLQDDEGPYTAAMNILTYLIYCYFQITRRIFTVELKDKKEIDLWSLSKELENIMGKIMRDHPNPSKRFVTLLNDCDQLIDLTCRTDNGENWKSVWQTIRTY